MPGDIWKDFTYALRTLKAAPVFTIAAILSLGLGIGANTAIFSLIDQVLLRTLPVQKPEELVIVKSPGPKSGHVNSDEDGSAGSWSYPMYKDLRDKNTGFAGLIARFGFDANISFNGQTDPSQGELVSGNYFDVLGVRPALGRLLTPADDVIGSAQSSVVVLGHTFWTQHLGARPDILNQQIVLNGNSMTVVGVAPAGFFGDQLGLNVSAFVTMSMKPQMTLNWNGLDKYNDYWLNIIGRLKPNTSADQAGAQLQAIYRPLLEAEADLNGMKGDRRQRYVTKPIVLEPGASGRQILSQNTRQPLLVLMAMVGLVLLIACANVANLLVARATSRERETSVRLALGASRARLVRQCLTESLVIAGAGAGAGLAVANWTIRGLLQLMPPDSGTHALSTSLDSRVLLFTLVLTIVTGFVFGLLPALESSRTDVNAGLKSGTGSSGTSRHARIRKLLVVVQVAFTLLMVVEAGLFGKTLMNLHSVDLGLRTANIIRFRVAPALNGYPTAKTQVLFERLQSSLKTIPGVDNASMAQEPIFGDSDSSSNVTIDGYTAGQDEDMNLNRNEVGAGYFSTLGIPLISGREFDSRDSADAPKVCMINQATAERYFRGRDPIGYRIAFGGGDKTVPDMLIVGVVKNSKHSEVGEEVRRSIYTPYMQRKDMNQATFYVTSAADPTALMNTIRTRVRDLDATLPVTEMKTLETQIDESLYAQRLMTILSLAFGGLSVMLSGFGIYGVMSYLVSRRAREIGIRIAVGAQPSLVRWMIVRETLTMTAVGIAIGLPFTFLLGRAAQSLLYGMTGSNMQVTLAAIVAVSLLALAAGYFPARRATRIDPVTALRNE